MIMLARFLDHLVLKKIMGSCQLDHPPRMGFRRTPDLRYH
jgi:hypothetical protein